MKKIFFITLFLIIIFLSFLLSYAAITNKHKITIQENRYYWGNISPSFYDLNTFQYNSLTNTYSIDIFYELDAWHDFDAYIKSPDDKNDIIYLIFSTKYYPKNNKLEIKYKGFVSAKYIEDKTKQSGYKLSEIRIYHNNNCKNIPKLQKFIKDLRRWLSGGNKLTYSIYINDVTIEIYNAYKKGGWKDLKYIKNSLEEF